MVKRFNYVVMSIVFILFFCSPVWALVCCYEESSNNIFVSQSNPSCEKSYSISNGEFKISGIGTYEQSKCSIETFQRSCKVNGQCYNKIDGKSIFNGFNGELCSNLGGIISNYDSSCTVLQDSSVINNGGDPNQAEGGDDSGVSTIDKNDTQAQTDANNNIIRDDCAKSGFPHGLFYSAQYCNVNSKCNYEPYKAGVIGYGFNDYHDNSDNEDLPMELYEEQKDFYSCKALIDYKSCFDYKSQSSCKSDVNDLNCKWISSSSYQPVYGLKKSTDVGICITNITDNGKLKFFNEQKLLRSGNVIDNSGFEFGEDKWLGNVDVVVDDWSAFGQRVNRLNVGDKISQEIVNIASGKSYKFAFYVKGKSDLQVNIEQFDNMGNSIKNVGAKFSFDVEPFYEFERDILGSKITLESNTNVVKISVENVGADEIFVDNFILLDSEDTKLINDQIWYQDDFEIPIEANNCEKCFIKYGLNDCTSKKSDYLGDCEYVVSDFTKYLGEEAKSSYFAKSFKDVFLDEEYKWYSQSLSKSLLTCELYMNQIDCKNSNNYVNSNFAFYHKYSDSNLCKWDSNYGCFKDSDGDEIPDSLRVTKRNAFFLGNKKISDYSEFDYFLSKDVMPPYVYNYFYFMNSKGEVNYSKSSPSEKVGNVKMKLSISDKFPKRSNHTNFKAGSGDISYDFDKVNVVAFSIDNQNYSGNWFFKNYSQAKDFYVNLTDYFKDTNLNSVLVDGLNTIRMLVYDQSGNLGYDESFDFDIDISSPSLGIDFLNAISPFTLGSAGQVKFTAKDYSKLKQCSLRLSSKDIEDSNFNTNLGDFDIDDINGVVFDELVNVSDVISNTSLLGSTFNFSITCSDIFGQVSSAFKEVTVDLNTDLTIYDPFFFQDINKNIGFLNSDNRNLVALSAEDLSCSINNNVTQKIVQTKGVPLSSSSLSFLSSQGYNYLLNFSFDPNLFFKEGKNYLSFDCGDARGNKYSANILYYYDVTPPEFISSGKDALYDYYKNSLSSSFDADFNLKELELAKEMYNSFSASKSLDIMSKLLIGDQIYYEKGSDSFYTLKENSKIYYYVNGTNSWIGEINVTMNDTFVEFDDKRIVRYGEWENNITFDLSEDNYNEYGEELDDGLVRRDYNISFYDYSGNVDVDNFVYYFDRIKTPKIELKGDVVDLGSNVLTTKEDSPDIILDFNTASYRRANCSFVLSDYFGNSYSPKYLGFKSKFIFNMADFYTNFNISSQPNSDSVNLRFVCRDVYGFNFGGFYKLIFDNSKPEFEIDASLDKKVYLIPSVLPKEKIYDKVEDVFLTDVDLRFFQEEQMVNCSYSFRKVTVDSMMDSCEYFSSKSEVGDFSFVNLGEFVVFNDTDSSSVCNFRYVDNKPDKAIGYDVNLSVVCKDAVGLIAENSKVFKMNFVDDVIDDLIFDYLPDSKVRVNASVNVDFKDGFFLLDNDNGVYNVSDVLISQDQWSLEDFGLSFVFDYSSFEQGLRNLSLAYFLYDVDEHNIASESIVRKFLVDMSSPFVNLTFRDVGFDNQSLVLHTFTNELGLNFEIFDDFSSLREFSLVMTNKSNDESFVLINSSDMLDFNKNFVLNSKLDLFGFGNSYDEFVRIGNLSFNDEFCFTLYSQDDKFNDDSVTKCVLVKDILDLSPVDSKNAFVDASKNWYTCVKQPVLSFNTTKEIECKFYPIIDVNIEQRDANLFFKNSSRSFSVDYLSKNLPFFNSLKFPTDNLDVRILCYPPNENFVSFDKQVSFVDYSPDYVAQPDSSLILTDLNFEVFKQINVSVENKRSFPQIHCRYGYDKDSIVYEIGESDEFYDLKFFTVNVSDESGNIFYECEDKCGNSGLIKKIPYVFNKDVEISKVYFKSNDEKLTYVFDENDSVFYLPRSQGLSLVLHSNMNLDEVYDCSYDINEDGGVIEGFVDFFRELFFNYGYSSLDEGINSRDFYESRSSDLISIDSQLAELVINCMPLREGRDSFEKSYDIITLSGDDINYTISLRD